MEWYSSCFIINCKLLFYLLDIDLFVSAEQFLRYYMTMVIKKNFSIGSLTFR